MSCGTWNTRDMGPGTGAGQKHSALCSYSISLLQKQRVANVRLKCIAVSEEILFIAVAPCRVEENIPCGQRNAGVALTAVGVGSQ